MFIGQVVNLIIGVVQDPETSLANRYNQDNVLQKFIITEVQNYIHYSFYRIVHQLQTGTQNINGPEQRFPNFFDRDFKIFRDPP